MHPKSKAWILPAKAFTVRKPAEIILIICRPAKTGKERFRNVIRTHAPKSAKEILQAVIDEIDAFCHPLENEDDVTLVVVKQLSIQFCAKSAKHFSVSL
jgi:hypothetical protein